MDDLKYFMDKLGIRRKMPVTLVDGSFHVRESNEEFFDSAGFFAENGDLKSLLEDRCKILHCPVVYVERGKFIYGGFTIPANSEVGEGGFLLFGPVPLGTMRRADIWSYRNICGFAPEHIVGWNLSVDDFMMYFSMCYYAVSHRQIDEEEMLRRNSLSLERLRSWEEEIAASREQWDGETAHHSWMAEQKFWQMFRECLPKEELILFGRGLVQGELARESYHQMEYGCVIFISTASRIAMEEGVSPRKSYRLSDHFLQKLEQCHSQIEIGHLQEEAYDAFMTEMIRAKQSAKSSGYINACKDYIAAHRTQNIRVNDIAESLGVSHGYLTKIFTEAEGVTIRQYIIAEKPRAAADMIRFSDASLTDISEYLSFSSPSHMGQCFKKQYHMTPREYRDRYRVVEFA